MGGVWTAGAAGKTVADRLGRRLRGLPRCTGDPEQAEGFVPAPAAFLYGFWNLSSVHSDDSFLLQNKKAGAACCSKADTAPAWMTWDSIHLWLLCLRLFQPALEVRDDVLDFCPGFLNGFQLPGVRLRALLQ